MGTITLPDRGPIYLDACALIYSVERIEPYRTLIEPVWQRAKTGQFVIVTAVHHRRCTHQTEVSLPINTTLTDY